MVRVLALSLLFLAACGDDDPAAECTAGAARACTGAGACSGMQTCLLDGSGYGACTCESRDGGAADASMPSVDGGSDASPPPTDASASDGASVDAAAAAMETDAGATLPTGDCELLTSERCDGSEGCVFTASLDGTEAILACVGPLGDGVAGEPCDDGAGGADIFGCAPTFACDTSSRICRSYCFTETNEGCPEGETCSIDLQFGGMPTGVGLCSPAGECDLLDQDSCDEGQGCYLAGGSGACAPAGDVSIVSGNGLCEFSSDCAPGGACLAGIVGGMIANVCTILCRLGEGEPSCPGSAACRLVPGLLPEGVGVCLVAG